jgi:hypothetical protein
MNPRKAYSLLAVSQPGGKTIMNKSALRVAQLALAVLLICPSVSLAQELKAIQLPAPQTDGGRPLMQVLKDRVSSRNFNPEKLPVQVMSNML